MRQWTTLRTWPEMRSRWVDWANLILGIWLFISPWVLNTYYHVTRGPGNVVNITPGASPGDFWWVGGAIVLVALWALGAPWARWTEWLNMALAVWLFISPWVLGFAHVRRAAWDAWGVGVVVFLLAWAGLAAARGLWLRRPIVRGGEPLGGPMDPIV